MTTLQEVIAEPFTVFRRSFSGTKPTVPTVARTATQLVSDGWGLVGARGINSVKREGVKLSVTPEFQSYRGANTLKIQDRWIVGDEAAIEFALVDVSHEILALALHQTVTTSGSGATKYKEIGLGHPLELQRNSWLLYGRSPESVSKNTARNRFAIIWDGIVTSAYEDMPSLDSPSEIPFKVEPISLDSEPEESKYGIVRTWAA